MKKLSLIIIIFILPEIHQKKTEYNKYNWNLNIEIRIFIPCLDENNSYTSSKYCFSKER